MTEPTYVVQEVREWPGQKTPSHNRKRAPFKANWGRTLDVLGRELRHLNAGEVVLFGYFSARHIRRDGQLYADARPTEPGVVLEFKSRTKGTRFRFAADTFGYWQDNVDAIARSLEALRMIDRYGVTSGQQYEGFKALPSHGSTTMTTENAKDTIRRYAPSEGGTVSEMAIRIARAKAHPDRGGSHDAFVQVQEAERTLKAAGVLV